MRLKEGSIFLEENEKESLKKEIDVMFDSNVVLGRVFKKCVGIVMNNLTLFKDSEELKRQINSFIFYGNLCKMYENYDNDCSWGDCNIKYHIIDFVNENREEMIDFVLEFKNNLLNQSFMEF